MANFKQQAICERRRIIGLRCIGNCCSPGGQLTRVHRILSRGDHKTPSAPAELHLLVCIQLPSGKGKHEPTCKCNVCSTIKRRFKTLMMRKKKRQSEREAAVEFAQEKERFSSALPKIEHEKQDIAGNALLNMSNPEMANSSGNQMDLDQTTNKEQQQQLDLNCDPRRDDDLPAEAAGMSLTALVNAAALPSDMFVEQNEA